MMMNYSTRYDTPAKVTIKIHFIRHHHEIIGEYAATLYLNFLDAASRYLYFTPRNEFAIIGLFIVDRRWPRQMMRRYETLLFER